MQHTTPRTPEEIDEFVTALMARNKALYGGWSMGPDDDDDADVDSDDDSTDADGDTDTDADKDEDAEDWKAKFEAQQRINRGLERKTRKDLARIKQLESGKPVAKPGKDSTSESDEVDVDQIRADAKAEAAREVLAGRVEDKIEAKARAFADPEDAVAVLLRQHDIEDFIDDGKIDADAITDALNELGENKPHLLAKGKKFEGDGDGGARSSKPERPKSLGEAVSRHFASGNK